MKQPILLFIVFMFCFSGFAQHGQHIIPESTRKDSSSSYILHKDGALAGLLSSSFKMIGNTKPVAFYITSKNTAVSVNYNRIWLWRQARYWLLNLHLDLIKI